MPKGTSTREDITSALGFWWEECCLGWSESAVFAIDDVKLLKELKVTYLYGVIYGLDGVKYAIYGHMVYIFMVYMVYIYLYMVYMLSKTPHHGYCTSYHCLVVFRQPSEKR